jgi:hypothetical protein
MAVLVAGPKRAALSAEWSSHLAGETGAGLPSRRQARDALGFVASAIECRFADAVDAAWTPADAILKSRKLSNLLVFGPTATAALFILRHEGTLGVVTSAESISAIGVGLYGLVRVGRGGVMSNPQSPRPGASRSSKGGQVRGSILRGRRLGLAAAASQVDLRWRLT